MSAAAPPQSTPAVEAIRQVLIARQPVVALVSWEEERVEETLRHIAEAGLGQPAAFYTWSRAQGLVGPQGAVPNTQDPVAAFDAVARAEGLGMFLFRDLASFLEDSVVARRLRDLRRELSGKGKMLFLQSPRLELPFNLKRDVAVVDFPLPSQPELDTILGQQLAAQQPPLQVDADTRKQLVVALQGLTVNEAQHALHQSLFGKQAIDASVLDSLYVQKQQIARKEGVLEFVPQRWTVDDVGGLENLKQWLGKRTQLFKDESAEAAQLLPKGLLVMGISGCGKSLSVKAISALWNLPLFRLDMGQVFSGVHGSPEESFDRALNTMEALAPAILWIDEIEGGISRDSKGADSGTKGRIFATFLTWMQEKSGRVFVAATANRIDLLPAELLRKGRFDQIFFIDLPTEKERGQIFGVHLTQRGIDPGQFDIAVLAKSTKEWNGAEIEQCVVSAMVDAYADGKPVDEDALFLQIGKIVPLAKTMSEQIKQIKSWAHDRAIRASAVDRS